MKKLIIAAAALLLVILLAVLVARGGDPSPDTASDSVNNGTQSTDPSDKAHSAAHRIDVPYLSQVGLYPSGCETVSTLMALRYAGYSIDADNFIYAYLPQADEPYYGDDGLLYADSPYEAFIGSPFSEFSYGCYAPVIRSAVSAYLDDADGTVNAEASPGIVDLSGKTLSQLCAEYIDRDIPVIVWGTIGMQPIQGYTTWILPDGSEFTWRSQEHCLLLTGYDETYYYFNDPMEGKDTAYRRADAEQAYAALYSQALAIVP